MELTLALLMPRVLAHNPPDALSHDYPTIFATGPDGGRDFHSDKKTGITRGEVVVRCSGHPHGSGRRCGLFGDRRASFLSVRGLQAGCAPCELASVRQGDRAIDDPWLHLM